MPRAEKSKISTVVAFFRSVSLDVMDIAKELVDDVVRERRGKSAKAKARVTSPALVPATANAAAAPRAKVRKKAAAKKSHHKKKIKLTDQPLPLDALSADAGEAGDAPDVDPPAGSTLMAP